MIGMLHFLSQNKERHSSTGMAHHYLKKIILTIAVIFFGLLLQSIIVYPYSQLEWEVPERIPGMVDAGLNPYFVVDSTGKLHLFNSQELNNQIVILYSNWTAGIGWSVPIDIIALDAGQQRIGGAFIDDIGMMNIILWGGDSQYADLFFSRAPINECMLANAWSTPVLIGRNAIAPTTVSVVTNQAGYIVAVYTGDEEGHGLYSVSSYDYGSTWTAAKPMYFTGSNVLWPTALKMVITEDEMIHAVWALGDTTGNSRRIFHAALPSMAEEWNTPKVLAEAVEFEADTPNIVNYNGRLIVVYHNDFPTTRFVIYSDDNGEHWSLPARVSPLVGFNGSAAFVIDGNDTLHMFFGNRTEDDSKHGVWHSVWLGDGWSIPKAVIAGPQVLRAANGEEGFDPDSVQSVICQGNILFVAWRHDPSAGPVNIWYTYQYLDSSTPPVFASQAPISDIMPAPEVLPSQMAIEPAQENFSGDLNEVRSLTTSQTFFFSIAPAAVVIIISLWLRRKKVVTK